MEIPAVVLLILNGWYLLSIFCENALKHKGIPVNDKLPFGARYISTYLGELLG